MKNITLTFLLAFALLAAKAKPINDSTAKIAAYNFLSTKFIGSKLGSIANLTLAYKVIDSNTLSKPTVCYYVFNVTSTKGFVIIAADDNISPIIGYSTESNYGGSINQKMPLQIRDWMGGYTKKIATAIKNNVQATVETQMRWQQLMNPSPKSHYQLFGGSPTSVSPLLPFTWSQADDYASTPTYNALCPYDPKFGSNVETGCVATAMAQVMAYWKYPAKGIGKHTYTPYSYPYLGPQTVNFDSTTYQWSLMANSITGSSSAAQINAVATLMYSCGVSVDMDYGVGQVDGSGSYAITNGNYTGTTSAQSALVNNFGYDNKVQGLVRSNYTDAVWIGILKAELDASRPVIYTGYGSAGGHCFVADGYDNTNMFHFNWGWDGSSNGYFTINNLAPQNGPGVDSFDNGQQAVIGIQPNIVSPADKGDSLALVTFYNSTNGDTWIDQTGWLSGPVGTWYGIKLDINGKVTAINLSGNNLSGTIALSLTKLNKLTWLDLSNNNFTGPVPAMVLNLDSLTTLDLSHNSFSGTIPDVVGDSSRLTVIDLSNNQFTGTIPNSFNKFYYLYTLDLSDNQLSGSLPSLAGDTTWLYGISIANNNYSSPIPTAFITGLKYINVLDISGNQFSGTLPVGIYNMPYIYELDVSNNKLTGSILSTISNDTYLNHLILANNQFSGIIPSKISALTSLTYLDISNNQFSGTLPSTLKSMTQLFVVDITNNNFTFTGMNYASGLSNANNSVAYAPQNVIPMHITGTKLSCGAGGTLATNTYKWYNASGLVYTKKGDSTYTPTVSGNYYALVTSTTASKLTLHTDTLVGGPLPVNFQSINATLSNGKTLINWTTATELNTDKFVIQHSTNGYMFADLGSVKAIGSGANSYHFTDVSPVSRINYYRIKSVDNDGAITYSKVVTTQLTVKIGLSVYPNPTKSSLKINAEHIASVQVIDNMGKIISTQSLQDASYPNIFVNTLPAGAYYLRIQTTDGTFSNVGFIKE